MYSSPGRGTCRPRCWDAPPLRCAALAIDKRRHHTTGCTVFVKANTFCCFLPHLHSEHKAVKAADVSPPTHPPPPLSEGSDGMRCWLNHLWVDSALQPREARDGWLDETRVVLTEGSGSPPPLPPPASVLIAASVMICLLQRRTRAALACSVAGVQHGGRGDGAQSATQELGRCESLFLSPR